MVDNDLGKLAAVIKQERHILLSRWRQHGALRLGRLCRCRFAGGEFFNLISNAIKYTPGGRVTIWDKESRHEGAVKLG